mgnify:CR=1 FL=1
MTVYRTGPNGSHGRNRIRVGTVVFREGVNINGTLRISEWEEVGSSDTCVRIGIQFKTGGIAIIRACCSFDDTIQ